MAVNLWLGLLLTLVAGLLSGNCMLPAKFARRWPRILIVYMLSFEPLWLRKTISSFPLLTVIPGLISFR